MNNLNTWEHQNITIFLIHTQIHIFNVSAILSYYSFNISYHFNYCSANPGFGASPGVWREIRPICSRRPQFQNWFSFTLFPLTGRMCHFRFRVLANHLASIFFPPVAECKDLLVSILTWIRYLRNWPRFLFQWSVLGLLIQTRRDCSNSLFLFSQWKTTWQYP